MGMAAGTVWKPLVSVSYSSLVWDLALTDLVKQTLHIKYGFDETTYQIQRPVPSSFRQKRFLKVLPLGVYVKMTFT